MNSDFYPLKGLCLATTATATRYTDRDDLVVFGFPGSTNCAAVFTQNTFAAAPVLLAKKHLKNSKPGFWLINAGNANAATGEEGFNNAKTLCEYLSRQAKCSIDEVIPFSTGVIGEQLPIKQPGNSFEQCISSLDISQQATSQSWHAASKAILTTDTRPKWVSTRAEYQGESFTINAIAKGSGMICPNMATMLAFIVTDAAISQPLLQTMLHSCAEKTFNTISVDGDTSTNDAVACAAMGTANLPEVDKNKELKELFKHQLLGVCDSLAQSIVRDGEGATRYVAIEVTGCNNQEEGQKVARSIAHSPLVKTALFAGDPNWGRIAGAIGNAGIDGLDCNKVDIFIDDLCIMKNGTRAPEYTEEQGKKYFDREDIWLNINLNRGSETFRFSTTDLGYEYIRINADYRS